MTLLP
jgi:flagellar biosynthetic protein FliO